ncbi:MAG: 7-cyano-7-deazaguanine synthase QueC, partial [Lentisphaeria bacterium]|nr:7-cyano-7-deazaguanine synthase QueC [Lentisphaeria bacterium]
MKKRAVVLLSGGLDSATCLAVAKAEGFEVYALTFDYGQRHAVELECAEKIANFVGVAKLCRISFDLRLWGGSALTDDSIDVPAADPENGEKHVPITYVPARNLVFLSLAASWGEVIGAHDIFIGVNSIDYSNYPDCRAPFISSFAETARLGTC